MPLYLTWLYVGVAGFATLECVLDGVPYVPVFKTIPAVMLSLCALFYTRKQFGLWVALGVLCGAGGDYSLSLGGRTLFYTGLSSFLVGHLAYYVAFAHDLHWTRRKAAFLIPACLVVAGIIAGLIVRFIHKDRPELIAPVALYGMILAGLMVITVLRQGLTWLIPAGAIIFVISDGTIAVNHMMLDHSLVALDVTIYTTYYIAQYLITAGAARETRMLAALSDKTAPPMQAA